MLSRRARQLAAEPDARKAFSARRIPKEVLHASIREDVWSLYHRGKYDTAVFEAMKAVEVAVRDAAGLSAQDLGTALMRKAFAPEDGVLADMSTDKAEREARAHLFAGAIGSYKNPQSHRHVALDDPDETAEIIMLANHLLRMWMPAVQRGVHEPACRDQLASPAPELVVVAEEPASVHFVDYGDSLLYVSQQLRLPCGASLHSRLWAGSAGCRRTTEPLE
jgi:uncharacterized protein (TIGR02391 family)